MEKLITVKDVKERYGCSANTARKYIRKCNPHLEDPLVTYEWALREWEQSRVVTQKMPRSQYDMMMRKAADGRVIVPRKREG